MSQVLAKSAIHAASQVFDDVVSADHLETLPTGEVVFSASRRGHPSKVTVTLNPNGIRACVEWRGRGDAGGYRVCRLHGGVDVPGDEKETQP